MSSTKKTTIRILSPGPILPGSITTAMAKCGKKVCRCTLGPDQRHGPYYRWTGKIDGIKTTITITEEEARECQRRIKNWKRFQEKLALAVEKAIARAPWNER